MQKVGYPSILIVCLSACLGFARERDQNPPVAEGLDGEHTIAHNKMRSIDGSSVITGSFNVTKAAEEKNAENLLAIQGQSKLAEAYSTNFHQHGSQTDKYDGIKDQPESGQKKRG